jgi:tellurite methyltransferase
LGGNLLLAVFEQAYRRPGQLFGSQPDPLFARMVIDRGLAGRALDIGAGDGRNSIFLARRGFSVEALDVAPRAVTKLRRAAQSAGLDIRPAVCDIRDMQAVSGQYDVIAADTVLCHLEPHEARAVAGEIAEALRPGGWLYVSAFGYDDPGQSEFAPLVRVHFDCQSLCALFPGLRPEVCREQTVFDRRHGEPHYHTLVCLTAEREGPTGCASAERSSS